MSKIATYKHKFVTVKKQICDNKCYQIQGLPNKFVNYLHKFVTKNYKFVNICKQICVLINTNLLYADTNLIIIITNFLHVNANL